MSSTWFLGRTQAHDEPSRDSPRACHNSATPPSTLVGMIPRASREEVIPIIKLRNWIVGLMLVALLAAGVVVLAGNGYGRGDSANTESCPAQAGGSLCLADADGDGTLNSEDPDWICPTDGSGCGDGAGYCQGLSANRPLDGSGSARTCGGGMGRGVRGCNGGRF